MIVQSNIAYFECNGFNLFCNNLFNKYKFQPTEEREMIRTFLFCFIVLSLSACTTTYLVKISPQSHFDYPNSNIEQLGYVTGQASESHFFSAATVTSTLEYDALTDALAKKAGADMLVNSYHVIDITSIPLLPITTITYKVDGTAVKMKVSDKPLSN